MLKILLVLFTLSIHVVFNTSNIPVVITTWRFVNATVKAWEVLDSGGSALDAVQQGTTRCEQEQCDGTVGYGGSPDENGETTLDAMIMDGKTMNVGAVAALRRIKSAAAVARHVLDHTKHSMLAGELATQFALQMGFEEESLTTPVSKKIWMEWHNEKHCQPNFWTAVSPDPTHQCGPYKPSHTFESEKYSGPEINRYNHDTIGMVAIDHSGNIAAGTSTNGAKHKIPGRVGDSPVAGAGGYADNAVGGAAATGDGDVMLRFLPSFLAVEEMRRGSSPTKAAQVAISRIAEHYPDFMGAVVAITKHGDYGAACNGIYSFPYIVHDNASKHARLEQVECNNVVEMN